MREGAKQRLIGAAAIVALVVIFVPMLFERAPLEEPAPEGVALPPAPDLSPLPKPTETFLGPEDSGVGALSDTELTDSQPLDLPTLGDLEPAPASGASGAAAPEPTASADKATPPPVRGGAPDEEREDWAPAPAATQSTAPATAAPAAVATRAPSTGMPSWVVQVASVATPDAAAELEGKLRKGGFSAFVEKAEVNGKLYYRVRVGPELDRARAERSAAELRQRYKVDTLIRSYP